MADTTLKRMLEALTRRRLLIPGYMSDVAYSDH